MKEFNDLIAQRKELDKQRKELDKQIKQLQYELNHKTYGSTVFLTRDEIWRGIYRLKIKKYSEIVDNESGKNVTLIEDKRLDRLYNYLKVIYKDIEECLNNLEYVMEVRNEATDE